MTNFLQCLQCQLPVSSETSAAQNSTETVNSVLKLAAPHCSVTAQSIWLALPCFTGQSQQGKEASSKFVRLCCCGAGCLVNYSCLCQCCCIPPIQWCLLAIRRIFVNVLDKFVDLSRPFLKVALRGRFSRPRGRRGRPTQSQQILHVPKSLRHPRHPDPIPR